MEGVVTIVGPLPEIQCIRGLIAITNSYVNELRNDDAFDLLAKTGASPRRLL